jgi:catechol 2,3-dioxygenase-like lactoylglutathione lyase family enzyme
VISTNKEIIMYDHVGLKVRNLDASVRFYTAALAPLGHVLCSRDDSGAGFGPKDAPALWLHISKEPEGPGAHVAFRAANHETIKAFHAAGLKAGGVTMAAQVRARITARPTMRPS